MMFALLILVGEGSNGQERQVLVSEEEFKQSGEKPEDFFVGSVNDAHVAGRLECEGDTSFISGCYAREEL